MVPDSELCQHSVEVVPGLMFDTKCVILDEQWICVPSGQNQRVGGSMFYWECRYRREKSTRCPFTMSTTVSDDNEDEDEVFENDKDEHVISHMMTANQHTCRQDITHVIDHKFRTKLKQLAESNFKFKYAQTFEKEKLLLLRSIQDKDLRERVSIAFAGRI